MLSGKLAGDLAHKERYPEIQGGGKTLPGPYPGAGGGLERYLMFLGPDGDGKSLITMLNDLAELFEQAVTDGTSVRDLVGSDPVEFAEAFMQNYGGGSWIRKERARLEKTIDHAASDEGR